MNNTLNILKQRLITGWDFMRILRLGLALILTAEALRTSETIFAVLGGFLAFQAIFNYGCCGAAGCEINRYKAGARPADGPDDAASFKKTR